jgi:UDP-glucose 4-epimerase
MTILVTGGAGYIGSHTLVQLIEKNRDVVVIDNLSNSTVESLRRIECITGHMPRFYHGDVQDQNLLQLIFQRHRIEAVIHFAGLKSVTESVADPLTYYRNNINSTLTLCQQMEKHHCFKLIFSSSATVYGHTETVPVTEDMPRYATSPYGRTKLMIEQMLEDLQQCDPRWSIVRLRYFNPAGAHCSGLIGEDPMGIPCNLLPYITQVAIGNLSELSVYGDDYDTEDGTGIRDFIHVDDLASAHVKSLEFLAKTTGLHSFNLGTGRGYSVLEMIKMFEQVTGITIPYQIKGRRSGDVGKSWASCDLAKSQLAWQARRSLERMIRDSWRWQSQNPDGYRHTMTMETTTQGYPLKKAS